MKKQKKGSLKTSPPAVFSHDEKVYSPDELVRRVASMVDALPIINHRGKGKVYNIPCSFDTETSSFWVCGPRVLNQDMMHDISRDDRDEYTPVAVMVCWSFEIFGIPCIGRTWEEFSKFFEALKTVLQLDEEKRLIVYVHNLPYDFQFFRKHIPIDSVFSTGPRNPVKVKSGGIEFRDSLILSMVTLEKMGKDLKKYKVQKLKGDWDYNKIRHPGTPLTPEEVQYSVNDCRVLSSYIQCKIEEEGDIDKIPLTNTGYVRRDCKRSTIQVSKKYRDTIKHLTITPEEYVQLKRTFQGGMTHGSCQKVGFTIQNVGSFDFTSSYPAVMIAEEFPCGRAPDICITSVEQLEKQCHMYCCMFRATFQNIREKIKTEHIISSNKCEIQGKRVIDNGRVVSADFLEIYITEQDYYSIKDFYDYDGISVSDFVRYYKRYLPSELVRTVLEYYNVKTQYKDVEDKKVEYLIAKGMVNSTYGMIVTDIVRSEYVYTNNEWGENPPNVEEQIERYNDSKSRFLYYPWGVWVTAYARRNLIRGIKECGDNYIYSDTDSIKYIIDGSEEFQSWIQNYNHEIDYKMRKAMKFHGFDEELYKPKTVKGIEKPLGVWDDDGKYLRFKTLGAKRYLVEKEDGEIIATVAGSTKDLTSKYLVDHFENPFDGFADGLEIPETESGKKCHTYIDDVSDGWMVDYLGNQYHYHELSSVHLSDIPFTIGMSEDYINYIKLIRVQNVLG